MKQLRLPIFTSDIKIYNLRIIPAEPIFDEVMGFKKQFESNFGKLPLSRSKPHIAIAAFIMNSKNQAILTKVLGQLAAEKKFDVTISGFDVHVNSNTLLLNIPKTKAIESLYVRTSELCKNQLKGKVESLQVLATPHMTISKTNGSDMLYKSLSFFQQAGYSAMFKVNHLTLVSRFKYKRWDWEHQIELS